MNKISLTKEQQDLVEENHNLIYGFAKKRNLDIEEYYGILAIGLCKAAMIYNNEKGNFSTLAFTCMESILYQQWRHEQRQSAIPADMIFSYDVKIDGEESDNRNSFLDVLASNDSTHNTVVGNIMKNTLLDILTEGERKIVELLDNGLDTVQIATLRGCSKQNISHRIKKIRNKLTNYLAIS